MNNTIEDYICYKRCTKVAVDWIWYNSKKTGQVAVEAFQTTSGIVTAAKLIQTSQKKVPGYVITALRDAIRHRWRVYNAFATTKANSHTDEKKARDNRHKSFIERLQKSLDLLLPLEANDPKDQQQMQTDLNQSSYAAQKNRFQSLSSYKEVATRQIHSDTNFTIAETSPLNEEPPQSAYLPLSLEDMVLKDDEFGEYCALSRLMNELDTLLETINMYWSEAANGKLPLLVAAWLSTTVFHVVERMFLPYSHLAPNYDILMQKWFKHRELWPFQIRFRDIPTLSAKAGPCWDGIALWYYGKLINDCRFSEEYKKIVPSAGTRQDPNSLIPPPWISSREVSAYDNAMDKMQESMRLGLVSKRGISRMECAEALEFVSEPLLPVLHRTLANKQEPTSLQLIYGYEMLMSSFRTFFWIDEKPNKQNCRLIALGFAMQIQKEVKKSADPALFRCKCKCCILQHLKKRLEHTASRLDSYIGEVRFDLYHQAPWTAGCHMVEMLTFAMFDGLGLCLDSGLVCSLLHLYNALIHLTPAMPNVEILDQLCQVFKDQLFLGTFPKENFSSHFRRAMGGTLSKTTEKGTPYMRIALPERGRDQKSVKSGFSLFYDLQNNHYGPTNNMWKRVYLGVDAQKCTSKQEREINENLRSVPFNVPLGKLKEAVVTEFTGSLPVSKLNYFAVHTFCAKLMIILDRELFYNGMVHGVHMVDDLLNKIMNHLSDSTKRRMLQHWAPMKLMKEVFADPGNQRSIEELVWAI